eukprot:2337301-Amphidinium_carterae.2
MEFPKKLKDGRQAIDGPFSLFMGGLIILNAFLMFLQLEYDGCAAGRQAAAFILLSYILSFRMPCRKQQNHPRTKYLEVCRFLEATEQFGVLFSGAGQQKMC